ncbi:MAG: V-type ATP synthase subunit F [Candidatus Aenigmatarchaeota archaeon]
MEDEEKKSIAVIGEDEFTLGFRLAGIQKVFDTENYAEKVQDLISRDDIGILIAEQSDVEELPNRIQNQVEESVDPVVVQLSEENQ